ncbi:MAG: nitrous oxide reductase family maturation protein NosD [Bacillota bacterium]|jgi:nitrous oxidase accessory protein
MMALVPILALLQVSGRPAVVVSPSGPVRTITEGLALAPAGGRIVVRAGVYREPTIQVTRAVEIAGDSGAILDGEGGRQLMTITADDVTVRGLVFRNVGASFTQDRAAVKAVGVRGCVIEDNRVENGFFGIYLARSTHCRIARNVLSAAGRTEIGSGNGIHLWSSDSVTIESNTITGFRDGIYFEFVRGSEIRGNTSERNLRYGLHFMYSDGCHYRSNLFRANGSGVAVMYSSHVEMVANRFEESWGSAAYGLLLKEMSDSRVIGNRFARNTIGLVAEGANRLEARDNDFIEDGWAVRLTASSADARFSGNNFIGNTFDVTTNSRETSSIFAGNYWDQYHGYDLGRDGYGDVPHRPVRLFSLIVEHNEPSLLLLRSVFVRVLDVAERALPVLTPETLADERPAMRPFVRPRPEGGR